MCDGALTIGESLRRCYTEVGFIRTVYLVTMSSDFTSAILSEVLREDDRDAEQNAPLCPRASS
jgi:hypothetical protein